MPGWVMETSASLAWVWRRTAWAEPAQKPVGVVPRRLAVSWRSRATFCRWRMTRAWRAPAAALAKSPGVMRSAQRRCHPASRSTGMVMVTLIFLLAFLLGL